MCKKEEVNNTKQDEEIDSRKIWRRAVWISIGIWVLGAIVTRLIGVYVFPGTNNNNSESAGLFGDSFGAVNALVSALAFAGVIVTFYLQRHELKLQYKELKAQREEFAQQNKTLKLQRFENTFFHMMELQQQIVNDLYIKVSNKEDVIQESYTGTRDKSQVVVDRSVRGRQVLGYIYNHFDDKHFRRGVFINLYDYGIKGYEEAPYLSLLDHYFRHLYTILRYVDESDAFDVNDEGITDSEYAYNQKYHYTTIVRATLSRYELLLLYYNGLSKFGKDKLKPLIEKYAILNNIDKASLAITKDYRLLISLDLNKEPNWEKKYGISGRDYEYYLTEEVDNPKKYNIRAFGCRDAEIEDAKQAIKNFEEMLAERSGTNKKDHDQ